MPLPPLGEQLAITQYLDAETAKFDTLTAEAQQAIDLLQERRTALISAAVTGKIDVRGLVEDGGRMSLHKEINLRERNLRAPRRHWLALCEGDAASYDRARAFSPKMCWLGCRHPAQSWEAHRPRTTARTPPKLLARLREQIDERGTLDVLRHGVEMLGLGQTVALAQFKPALAMNPEHAGPLCGQSPARRAAGPVLAAQRELHRPGAVPERHAGGDRGTQDRLHAKRGRRRRPVPLRPSAHSPRARPPSRCSTSRAARWCISRSATAKST